MSTSDPRRVRAERQAISAKSPAALLLLLFLGTAHTAIWLIAGYGLGGILDIFRLMSVNQTGSWNVGNNDGTSDLLAIGAISVGAVFGVFFTGRLARFGLGAAMLIPFCTAFLGLTFGAVLFIPAWTAPAAVGEKLAFIDGGNPVPWESDAWVAYYLPYWLPAAFALVLLLVVAATIAASRATTRTRTRMHDMAEQGTKVRGTITEAIATGTEIQGMPRIQFTARFRDGAGTDRWVTKKGTFPRASTPRAGDTVIVWFDAAEPHDEKKIMVGFGPEATELTETAAVLPKADSRG